MRPIHLQTSAPEACARTHDAHAGEAYTARTHSHARAGSEFNYYHSGVLTAPCGTSLNHGVLVVGYGTNEDGIDFWKVGAFACVRVFAHVCRAVGHARLMVLRLSE